MNKIIIWGTHSDVHTTQSIKLSANKEIQFGLINETVEWKSNHNADLYLIVLNCIITYHFTSYYLKDY